MKTETVNPRHTIEKLGDKWEIQTLQLASDTNKALYLSARFDGNGNAVVTFVIRLRGQHDINFEKCDAAVERYNSLP